MPVSPSRRRKAYSSIIVGVALLATLLLTGTAAAEVKPFSVVLSPPSVAAGQQAVIGATIENRSDQQALGSVNLTAPPAFTVRAASLPSGSAGSATVRGSDVQLRDLSLAPGAAREVAVTVAVGCGAGAYAWGGRAIKSASPAGAKCSPSIAAIWSKPRW